MTFDIIMHVPISFPRDGQLFGWVDGFGGYASSWQGWATQIIGMAEECEATAVLLRGYSGCADRHNKWVCGYHRDDADRPIETGVYCSAELPEEYVKPRRAMVARLRDSGLTVYVHDGPPVHWEQAALSAHILASDGVDGVVFDSFGNNDNLSTSTAAQMVEVMTRGKCEVFDEPYGQGKRTAFARVESDHFPWGEIKTGTVDPSRLIGWFNNPVETANDPKRWLNYCIQAHLRGVCIPYRILRDIKAKEGQ
jgi:hypothetical protein